MTSSTCSGNAGADGIVCGQNPLGGTLSVLVPTIAAVIRQSWPAAGVRRSARIDVETLHQRGWKRLASEVSAPARTCAFPDVVVAPILRSRTCS